MKRQRHGAAFVARIRKENRGDRGNRSERDCLSPLAARAARAKSRANIMAIEHARRAEKACAPIRKSC